jgi:hypothetical protein
MCRAMTIEVDPEQNELELAAGRRQQVHASVAALIPRVTGRELDGPILHSCPREDIIVSVLRIAALTGLAGRARRPPQ